MPGEKQILIVTTSHSDLPGEGSTGLWLEEFTVPYKAFRAEGHQATVASPGGGEVPLDPRSLEETDLPEDDEARQVLEDTTPLADVDPSGFDAVFFPGGHGTMWDLATDAIGDLVEAFAITGRPVAAVCHGPAALVEANAAGGQALVTDRRLTCFTDEEEREVGLDDEVPFLLESRLRELGAEVQTKANWAEHVVEDGWLITGQNPQSSQAVAKTLLSQLHG